MTTILSNSGDRRGQPDYDVAWERLSVHQGEGNRSSASVVLVLRRRTQFHAVNAFVHTFVVLVAAAATFFFDRDDFSDRILVNAVLLLVIATITSFVQAVRVFCAIIPALIFVLLPRIFAALAAAVFVVVVVVAAVAVAAPAVNCCCCCYSH